MSSKKKSKEYANPIMGASGEDLYLDTLTKDEKEALLNRKMLEIRRKNEELQRRHELIEADRRRAEKEGSAVSLKPPPEEQLADDPKQAPVKMRGVRVAVEPEVEKKSAFTQGRGRRLQNMKQEAHKAQDNQPKSNNRKPRPKSQVFEDKSQVQQEKAKRPKSQCFDAPPDEPSGSFLRDDRRQGPLPDNERQRSSRSRGNYGGDDFRNVRRQMEHEKQRGGRGSQQAPLDLTMTGKERRDYVAWREERDRIDAARMQRAQREPGTWKREWDVDKRMEDPMPPPSRRTEPGKRPGRGGGHSRGGGRSYDDQRSPRGDQMQSDQRSPRQRQDSDGRHVGEDNDTLVIQVVNDLSGEVLEGGRGRARGGYRGARGMRGGGGDRGGGYRGRGGGDRTPYDARPDYSPEYNTRDNREYRNYSDFRDANRENFEQRQFQNDYPPRGGYRGYRGGDRGGRGGYRGGADRGSYRGGSESYRGSYRGSADNRGGYRGGGADRGSYRGPAENYRGGAGVGTDRGAIRSTRKKKGWAEWEAEQAEREAIRAGRKPPPHEPLDTEILGRAIIVTTTRNRENNTDANQEELPLSPSSSPTRRGDKVSPNKLSGQSGDSWETTGTQESWETVEGDEEELEGDDGEMGEDMEELEDPYEEDDYWEDSLQLQGQAQGEQFEEFDEDHLDPTLELVSMQVDPIVTGDVNVQRGENGEDDERDIHNSSAESLERFIQEHTLHLNINTGNLEIGANENGDGACKENDSTNESALKKAVDNQNVDDASTGSTSSTVKTEKSENTEPESTASNETTDDTTSKADPLLEEKTQDSDTSAEGNRNIVGENSVNSPMHNADSDKAKSETSLSDEKTKDENQSVQEIQESEKSKSTTPANTLDDKCDISPVHDEDSEQILNETANEVSNEISKDFSIDNSNDASENVSNSIQKEDTLNNEAPSDTQVKSEQTKSDSNPGGIEPETDIQETMDSKDIEVDAENSENVKEDESKSQSEPVQNADASSDCQEKDFDNNQNKESVRNGVPTDKTPLVSESEKVLDLSTKTNTINKDELVQNGNHGKSAILTTVGENESENSSAMENQEVSNESKEDSEKNITTSDAVAAKQSDC